VGATEAARARDHGIARITHQCIWIAERRCVEEVKGLPTELESRVPGDGKAPVNRKIQIDKTRTLDQVAACGGWLVPAESSVNWMHSRPLSGGPTREIASNHHDLVTWWAGPVSPQTRFACEDIVRFTVIVCGTGISNRESGAWRISSGMPVRQNPSGVAEDKAEPRQAQGTGTGRRGAEKWGLSPFSIIMVRFGLEKRH